MTRIESETVKVGGSQKNTFDFLSDLNNIGSLMPEQVEDWECDGEKCSFKIKGMASLGMKYEEKVADSKLVLREEGKSPFPFKLICSIGEGEENCDLQLALEAELNPMMEMLAKKPLKNFLDLLVNEYSKRGIA
ncbi:MAG: hypothetical protein HKN22_01925 [Bacteroidia bacterium]|nr:hypothetical protein [Bacteroidia bacterium]